MAGAPLKFPPGPDPAIEISESLRLETFFPILALESGDSSEIFRDLMQEFNIALDHILMLPFSKVSGDFRRPIIEFIVKC